MGEIDGELSAERFAAFYYYAKLFIIDHGDELVADIKPSTVSMWLREPKPED